MKMRCIEGRPNGLPPIKRTYNGFCRLCSPDTLNDAKWLALVWTEGEFDMYAVRDYKGVEELRRYYEVEHGVTDLEIKLMRHDSP